MTNATHIGNKDIGSVCNMLVRVVGSDCDRHGDKVVRYVDVRGDGSVMVASAGIFDRLFRAV